MKNVRKYTPDEDAPLLAAWQRGDIFSFETLIWKYLKRVYNLSHLLTGDPKTAAEAVQNAFVSAYREIGSLRSTSRFSTWLAGLTIKESRKLLDFNETSTPAKTVVDVKSAESSTLSSALGSPPFQGDIRGYIATLPPELGEVIVLRYLRGYSLERMEEILQIRTDILISRLFDAQEILAALMKQGASSIRTGIPLNRDDSLPHPEIRRILPSYIDNAADEEEKNLIRKHLGGCGSCREALAELEWMVEHLKSFPDIEPPHWLTAAIMTKIRSAGPYEPTRQSRSFPPLFLAFLLGVSILTMSGISWYFMSGKDSDKAQDVSRNEAAKNRNLPPAAERKPSQPLPALPPDSSTFGTSRKGAPPSDFLPASPAAQTDSPSPSFRPEIPPPVLPKPAATSGGLKPDTAPKKTRTEITPQLPQDWGRTLPSNSVVPGKSASQKSRSGEVSVLLGVDDPTGSAQAIEQAVTALGGKINGRAYSGGNDILYTQIESDKFFELMKRLGKIGKLLELPQIHEEEAGSIDLVIRW